MDLNLRFVTLTGADDTVDPAELVKLSGEFPLVEWGILIGSHSGESRFPSDGWFERLIPAVSDAPHPVNLSLHICGWPLRSMILQGSVDLSAAVRLATEKIHFNRCQLNFHGDPITTEHGEQCIAALDQGWFATEVITQLDRENDWFLDRLIESKIAMRFARGVGTVSGLHDVSHGAGVVPVAWPPAKDGWDVGYAGGLGPANVLSQLPLIAAAAGGRPTWIDMETKLYDDRGRFSLGNCREVLEIVDKYQRDNPAE